MRQLTEQELAEVRVFHQALAKRIRALRAKRKMSQRGLARKSGLAQQTIVKLESQIYIHDPQLRVLRCVARALRVSVSALLRVKLDGASETEETEPKQGR